MSNVPWLGLERELDELERKDPKVRAARKALDDLPAQLARHDRHIAARKAVGKRKIPEDDR
jgi:hypothetical protein